MSETNLSTTGMRPTGGVVSVGEKTQLWPEALLDGQNDLAKARMRLESGLPPSRALSCVLTKIDEAELWLSKVAV